MRGREREREMVCRIAKETESRGLSPEVIEETTNRNWVRGHSWDILDKSLAIFCWCLENFNEDDFNSNELSRLLEKKFKTA